MIKRFANSIADFLGPARLQALFWLLAVTGLLNLILNAFQGDWVRPVQSALVLVFVVGAAVIIGGRMDPEARGRWLAVALPAIGALLLGVVVMPQYLLAFAGGALGWVIAGLFIFRSRTRMEYQVAVKHLRKSEYAEAVQVMDRVIKAEPKDVQHYRFRAEVLRLWGKLDRARRDYQEMVRIDPQSAVGYNGLAEVDLQAGRYDAALEAARQAYQLAPNEWVAAYNLGMIEDRLGHALEAIEHLNRALAHKVPETRHRVLIYFYLARAYSRLGDMASAQEAASAVKQDRRGLNEWATLLQSDQAVTLRDVIGPDVEAARALIDGRLSVEALASEGAP